MLSENDASAVARSREPAGTVVDVDVFNGVDMDVDESEATGEDLDVVTEVELDVVTEVELDVVTEAEADAGVVTGVGVDAVTEVELDVVTEVELDVVTEVDADAGVVTGAGVDVVTGPDMDVDVGAASGVDVDLTTVSKTEDATVSGPELDLSVDVELNVCCAFPDDNGTELVRASLVERLELSFETLDSLVETDSQPAVENDVDNLGPRWEVDIVRTEVGNEVVPEIVEVVLVVAVTAEDVRKVVVGTVAAGGVGVDRFLAELEVEMVKSDDGPAVSRSSVVSEVSSDVIIVHDGDSVAAGGGGVCSGLE